LFSSNHNYAGPCKDSLHSTTWHEAILRFTGAGWTDFALNSSGLKHEPGPLRYQSRTLVGVRHADGFGLNTLLGFGPTVVVIRPSGMDIVVVAREIRC
jgi:hypothetical protein